MAGVLDGRRGIRFLLPARAWIAGRLRLRSFGLALLPAVAATVVLLLGLLRIGWADPVGSLVAGLSATGCGGWLLLGAIRSPDGPPLAGRVPTGQLPAGRVPAGQVPARRPAPRRLAGVALLLWGAGSLLQGGLAMGGTHRFPTPGDLLELLAAPPALLAGFALQRRGPGSRPPLRLALDTAMLGVAVGLVAWRGGLRHLLEPFGFDQFAASLVVGADITFVSLAMLIALRERDRALVALVAGTVLFGVGDVVAMHTALEPSGSPAPWLSGVLWVPAYPLITFGVLRYRAPAERWSAALPVRDPFDADAHGLVIATTVSLALLCAGVLLPLPWAGSDLSSDVASGLAPGLAPASGSGLDDVARVLVCVAVAVLAARELLDGRLRADLLRRLRRDATVDPLTGLANRAALTTRLAAVPAAERWCLLVVGLDRFKAVNDLAGHAAGDRLLRAVGARLRDAAPSAALVARVGGDEFAVLVPGPVRGAAALGQRIVAAVRGGTDPTGSASSAPVSASIGVAAVVGQRAESCPDTGPTGPTDPLTVLGAAGMALRSAKRAGGGRVELYDAPQAQVRRRRLTVEERLRSAIAAGEVHVHFQPIVDLRSHRLAGVEALARWSAPDLGYVQPSEFIPVAEETGLVGDLGELILNEALRRSVEIGLVARGLRVSCNVSPVQLRAPAFHRVVAEALAAHRVDPGRLVLEVTEAVLVEEEGPAVRTLHRLADAGVTIAIDDFGTGYSALGYLRRLPAHILKLDRSLTSSLLDEPRALAITRAVVDLGSSIGLSVVAEGIEAAQVADLVAGMGVGYGQGSYFGAAVDPSLLLIPGARLPA